MSVRDEIQQTRPFPSVEMEAFVALQLTAERLAAGSNEVLKAHGLTSAQYNALRILRGAGEKGLCCGEIAARMIARDPDVTRLLDRLADRGLVVRTRDEGDRRTVVTRIAPAGREALKPIDPQLEALHRRQLGGLGPKRLQTLLKILDDARAGSPKPTHKTQR